MNWVIVFTRTGAEEKLVTRLAENLKLHGFIPFIPARHVRIEKKGTVRIERELCFPGYLFLQTDIEAEKIADKLFELLKNTKHVYSVLHYGDDKSDVVVKERERSEQWEKLFDEDFCIKGSEGFIEGGQVCVTSGPLVGLEGIIKKINRHTRKATVEIEMMGSKRELKLLLDIVRKTP